MEPIEDACDLVFHDEEEWWRWAWSHDTRRLFEAVPAARLDDLKQRLFLGLQACRRISLRVPAAILRTKGEPCTWQQDSVPKDQPTRVETVPK